MENNKAFSSSAKFILGIVVGLLVCMTAFYLTNYTDLVQYCMPRKPLGLYVLAIGFNFVSVWFCYKRGLEPVGKGLVLVTFLALIAAIITKSIYL